MAGCRASTVDVCSADRCCNRFHVLEPPDSMSKSIFQRHWCMQAPQCVHCYGVLDHPSHSVTLQSLLCCLGIYAVPDTCHSGVSQNCSLFRETVGTTHHGPRNGREAVFDLSRVIGLWSEYTESFITHCPAATAAYTTSTPIDAPSAKPISFRESAAPQILTCNTSH